MEEKPSSRSISGKKMGKKSKGHESSGGAGAKKDRVGKGGDESKAGFKRKRDGAPAALVKKPKEEKTEFEKARDRKAKQLYRGDDGPVSLHSVVDKKLRTQLSKSEKKFQDAALANVRAELLLPEEAGFVEAEGPMERTYRLKQDEIRDMADVATAAKVFSLDLTELGPYTVDYTRNGRHFLLGGSKGHVALVDALRLDVVRELHLGESVRDVKFLHNETMFAVAQRKYVYVYDNQGVELHRLKQHIDPVALDFLPYHFLLVSGGRAGYVKWHDVSTGDLVAEHNTRKGGIRAMRQNPYNAVMHCGHANGVVSLWSPSVGQPLVSMLCHRGPLTALAMDTQGLYMATAGMDGEVRVWDLRTYKKLHFYQFTTPPSSLDISQRNLLGVGFGCHVHIWKDALANKVQSPYLRHDLPGSAIETLRFRPYEDVLGVAHRDGFVSMVVPGAGEPNFDTLEANPFQTRKQRRETEVHSLLDKLQPEMIMLDPKQIGRVDRDPTALAQEQRQLAEEADRRPKKEKKEKNKMRGKSKIGKKLARRQQNVIDDKLLLLRKKREEELEAQQGKKQKQEEEARRRADKAPSALQRFFTS